MEGREVQMFALTINTFRANHRFFFNAFYIEKAERDGMEEKEFSLCLIRYRGGL